ncbi:hypothetical protein [Nonomuraea wenchangensis]|uniref:Uncharacterized protein n=1 Tax=Nonomuraea wenchangensis TaxID=568860 RepID=A0A1I0LUB8_9ACTN|nr:hypothetical protein [Nonomuraea wenchangensis]SEU46689.1 hypothetical protein SAMN05421811_127119 [Nonomuraea wenchangensis]
MSLFNLAHAMGRPGQNTRTSLGVHMSPTGEPCSLYRDPDSREIEHVIERDVDGVEVEVRAAGACPALNLAPAIETTGTTTIPT